MKSRNPLSQLVLSMVCLSVLALNAWPAAAFAQQASAPDYLPDTTAIYAHIADPSGLIETIEAHPVLHHVLEMKQVKQLMRSPQFAMAMLGRGMLEQQLGEDVIKAAKRSTANGIWIAVDTETNGAMVMFQSEDEEHLKKTAGKVLKFVSTMAAQGGDNEPFKKRKYRGAVAAEFDGLVIARYKNWFMMTNEGDLIQKVVDNMVEGSDSTLANSDWFKLAIKNRTKADVWTAIDVEKVRELTGEKEPFLGRTDNPGVELIFGGILDLLKNTPVAFGELNIGEQIDFSMAAPFDAKWANESREFFFGKDLGGFAPKALVPKNMIANLTSYRDVGLWWLSKEDLYAESVIAELANADSQLSTIFSGMDFGEDVLGSLEPGVQIVVTENQYDDKYVPDIKIPAFALVGKLKDPEKLQRKLKIAFQSVIGFANINLGMNGQPQLELENEKIGDTRLSATEYFYEEGTEEGLLIFNFGPTIAFHGSHLILSSKRELAVELAEMVAKGNVDGVEDKNTQALIDGQMLHKVLVANREALVAQNMLEDGNSKKEAEEQMDILFAIADLFKDAQLDYDVTDKQMKFDLSVRFDELNSK